LRFDFAGQVTPCAGVAQTESDIRTSVSERQSDGAA
jgi:hypothetical protein